MNKSQQMRWSRNGADLLLQVRCAVYNGTLGAGLGINLTGSPMSTWPLPKRHDPPISGQSPRGPPQVAQASLQHWIAVVPQPPRAHRRVKLDERGLTFWVAAMDSDVNTPPSCNPDLSNA